MAGLRVMDRFRSIYGKDGWIFSAPSRLLPSVWAHGSAPPVPCQSCSLSGPVPQVIQEGSQCPEGGGHREDKVRGVEPPVHPNMPEPGLRSPVRLLFLWGVPYFFQVDFLKILT